MRLHSIFTITVLTLALAACGGGGGGNDDGGSDDSIDKPQTRELNGIYGGSFTQQGLGTFDLQGFVYNGRIVAITEGANTIYDGSINAASNSRFKGNVNLYEINGGVDGNASLDGNFERRSSLNGSFDQNDGSSGTFSLDYDPIYERDSDLSLLNDVWTFTDGPFTMSVSIDPDGSFRGSDTDGCLYSGKISIIDSPVNIYSVDFTATRCNRDDGDYSGFVSLADRSQTNDTMIVAGSNGNSVFIYQFARQ